MKYDPARLRRRFYVGVLVVGALILLSAMNRSSQKFSRFSLAGLIGFLVLTGWAWLGESATSSRSETGGLAIYPARRFMILFPALFALMVIAIVSSSRSPTHASPGLVLSAVVVVVLGALFAYGNLKGALVKGPALIIDRTGLNVDAPFAHLGHLNWDEVDRVVIQHQTSSVHRSSLLGIYPHDPGSIVPRLSIAMRSGVRYAAKFDRPTVKIPLLLLIVSEQELVDALEEFANGRYGGFLPA